MSGLSRNGWIALSVGIGFLVLGIIWFGFLIPIWWGCCKDNDGVGKGMKCESGECESDGPGGGSKGYCLKPISKCTDKSVDKNCTSFAEKESSDHELVP